VLAWPGRNEVHEAVRRWADAQGRRSTSLCAVGYFGSYARGNAGVGSDVDIVLIVSDSERPFHERALDWDATRLPVPADVLVYTTAEWDAMMASADVGFARRLRDETVWVLGGS
jgi:predicted nucleotidyltransferase